FSERSPDPPTLPSSSAQEPLTVIFPDPDTRASISPVASTWMFMSPDPLTHRSISSVRIVPSAVRVPEPLTPSPSTVFIVIWAVTCLDFHDRQFSSGTMFSRPPLTSVFTWASTSGSPSKTTLCVLPCFTVTVPGTPKLTLVNSDTLRASFFCAVLIPGTANLPARSTRTSFFICCGVKCYRNRQGLHAKVASDCRVPVL